METQQYLETIDLAGKGIGAAPEETPLTDVGRLGWNLLREDLSLPAAVLSQDTLDHNLRWMQQFIAAYHVNLAPHGKTTMCPALFDLQMRGGAWGITLATASQTRAAYRHGARRVLMANQLIGLQNMTIVADLLHDTAFEFYCLVDSVAGVDQLGRFFSSRQQRINVLLELGEHGGRTGVRDAAGEAEVLAAIGRWPDAVSLAGIEVYEGVLPDEAAIRAYLRRAVSTIQRIAAQGQFGSRERVVLTGAGSAWFDVVAEEFANAKTPNGTPHVDVVLRPGCYLTHDVGAYREAQKRMAAGNAVVQRLGDGLRPAMHIWAYVQSRPEPQLAIIALGKRDAAFDAGLPTPALQYRPGGGATAPEATPAGWTLTKIMDQHAYMQVPADADVRVGDMIAFDISHPCLTWDKWRQVAIVDRDYHVVDLVQTYF